VKNPDDHRPESYRPADVNQLNPVGHLDTSSSWRERRRLLLQIGTVHNRLLPLIDGAKANRLSLATFKPQRVLDFFWEPEESREWDGDKEEEMRNRTLQGVLFEEDAWRQTFKLINKLPYKFSYQFEDADGKNSTMQILDWEIGQLYWNCLKQANNDEATALAKVKEKYFVGFLKKDLHFFLGTQLLYHSWAQNPWIIIGVLPVPYEGQMELL
jgi:hypothetical protein